MSREIKFNAWNKETNTMHYDITNPDNWSFSFLNKDVFTWLEWTSLKDRIGKDIYEGDVIDYGWGKKEVVFSCGTFGVVNQHPDGVSFGSYQINSGKVVGNIYANKDLL